MKSGLFSGALVLLRLGFLRFAGDDDLLELMISEFAEDDDLLEIKQFKSQRVGRPTEFFYMNFQWVV